MKIAVCSDLHLEGQDLQARLPYVRRFLSEARERDCAAVVCCGDVFERPGVGDVHTSAAELLSQVSDLVDRWGLPWFVAKGNHDAEDDGLGGLAGIGSPLVRAFAGPPSVFRFGEAVFVAAPWRCWDGQPNFHARAHAQVAAAVEMAGRSNSPVVVFGHAAVVGSDMGGRPWKGSDQCWSPRIGEIGSLPADYVFLGHHHKRQDMTRGDARWMGYVGALMRRNHGEAENPDGWMLVDLSAGSHKFVDLGGPRYYTVSSPESAPSLRPGDKVRVSAPIAPPAVRSLPVLDPGSEPVHLLRAWASWGREVRAEVVEAAAEELRSLWPEHRPPGIPSVEELCELHQTGFRTRGFTSFGSGWSAVVGPSRSGKTTLLEMAHACLFGSWPYGRGTWTSNAVTAAPQITLRLRARGEVWEVERAEGDVRVYRFPSGTRHLEVGGKSKAKLAGQLIRRVFGSPEGWQRLGMLGQGGRLSLVEAGDADRMRAFRQLLGLEDLEALASVAKTAREALPPDRLAQATEAVRTDSAAEKDARSKLKETESTYGKAAAAEAAAVLAHNLAFVALTRARQAAAEVVRLEQEIQFLRSLLESHAGREGQAREFAAAQKQLASLRTEVSGMRSAALQKGRLREEMTRLRVIQENSADAGCRQQGYLPCKFLDEARRATARLSEIRSVLESLTVDPEALAAAERRVSELEKVPPPPLASLEETTASRLRELTDEVSKIRAEHQDVPALEEAEVRCRGRLEQAQAALRTATAEKASASSAHKYQAEALKKTEAWLEEERQRGPRRAALDLLHEAFDRKGIPQVIVAASLPAIQEELDALAVHFPDDLRPRLTSLTDAGTEVLRILIGSGEGWDARFGSGAERAVTSLLLQCAVLRWRNPEGGGVLLVDEPTAHMDPAMSLGADSLLRDVGSRFRQVIVATHDEVLAGSAGSKVRCGQE